MSRISVLLMTALPFAVTIQAAAAPISGVTVTSATSPAGPIEASQYVVDGSGLSAYLPTATHSDADGARTLWGTPGMSLTFDLHGLYSLTGMALWNWNGNYTYGVNALDILGSTDGVTFAPLPGAPSNLAIGSFGTVLAEQYAFTATVSHLRFDVISNHGGGLPFAGFAEVMFLGAAVDTPEPASSAVLVAGLAGLGLARRRHAPPAA